MKNRQTCKNGRNHKHLHGRQSHIWGLRVNRQTGLFRKGTVVSLTNIISSCSFWAVPPLVVRLITFTAWEVTRPNSSLLPRLSFPGLPVFVPLFPPGCPSAAWAGLRLAAVTHLLRAESTGGSQYSWQVPTRRSPTLIGSRRQGSQTLLLKSSPRSCQKN